MEFKINRISDRAIKITSAKKFTNNEINQLFGQYGKIDKIVSGNNYKIIYFSLQESAERCIEDSDRILTAFRGIDFDYDSTGDTACKNDENENFSKIKRLFKQLTQAKANQTETDKAYINKPITNTSNASSDSFTPACSSPVLLSTADPGFRLAYCHNVTNLRPDLKIKKLNRFNQSIKNYMDDTRSIGVQELVLTNLPKNVKKEDIYKICGQIEPAIVELKTTANINVLYAYIKLKSKEDFNKLNSTLGNSCINGMKITAIPITKITEPILQSPPSIQPADENKDGSHR